MTTFKICQDKMKTDLVAGLDASEEDVLVASGEAKATSNFSALT